MAFIKSFLNSTRMAVPLLQALLWEVHKLHYLKDALDQHLLSGSAGLMHAHSPVLHCNGVVTSRLCSTGQTFAGHNIQMYRGKGSAALVPAQGEGGLQLQDRGVSMAGTVCCRLTSLSGPAGLPWLRS